MLLFNKHNNVWHVFLIEFGYCNIVKVICFNLFSIYHGHSPIDERGNEGDLVQRSRQKYFN